MVSLQARAAATLKATSGTSPPTPSFRKLPQINTPHPRKKKLPLPLLSNGTIFFGGGMGGLLLGWSGGLLLEGVCKMLGFQGLDNLKKSTTYSCAVREFSSSCVVPCKCTLPETNMETQKGAYKDYSPFKWVIWVSMLVWGSVLVCYRPCGMFSSRIYRGASG